MKRSLCVATLVAWIGCLAGCAQTHPLTELPDPVFGTVRQARVQLPPTPAPVSKPQPAVARMRAEPGWIPPGGISSRWGCIVIHHSAGEVGGAKAFDRYHRNVRKWDELGYHFVIGNGSDTADGRIEVGSRWTKQKHGAHCVTPDRYYNDHGIGICLVGNFNNHPPSPAQMASLTRLVDFLMAECGFDASRVLTHRGVTGRTECPGAQFSLAALKARLGSHAARASHAP